MLFVSFVLCVAFGDLIIKLLNNLVLLLTLNSFLIIFSKFLIRSEFVIPNKWSVSLKDIVIFWENFPDFFSSSENIHCNSEFEKAVKSSSMIFLSNQKMIFIIDEFCMIILFLDKFTSLSEFSRSVAIITFYSE